MSATTKKPAKNNELDASEVDATLCADPDRRTFTDGAGRPWELALDFDTVDEIRDQFDLDFGNVEKFTQTWAKLLWDDQLALRVLWFLVHEHAGDTPEKAWRKTMNGELLDAARAALLQAVFFFTPPSKRHLAMKATAGVTDFYHQAISEAETKVEAAVSETISRFRKTQGTSPTKSPASWATGRAAGRSAGRSRR